MEAKPTQNGGQVLALITARGGSKGLPRKNVLDLAGRPLIAWSIKAAQDSASVGRVIVSTDDAEIAQAARDWGAEVPFPRPAGLAADDTPHIQVILHALDWLENHGGGLPDYLLLLQPTSPLRTADDIDQAAALARAKDAEAVVSVCPMEVHPYLARRINPDGTLERFLDPGLAYLPRQALPPLYAPNGAIYLNRCQSLRREQTFFPQGQTYPYIMPIQRSLDIDTAWDLRLARLILADGGPDKETAS